MEPQIASLSERQWGVAVGHRVCAGGRARFLSSSLPNLSVLLNLSASSSPSHAMDTPASVQRVITEMEEMQKDPFLYEAMTCPVCFQVSLPNFTAKRHSATNQID
ncbi:unnamed protein product [Gongylonema pulchrum]|uniref:RING-type domain-containing protein n=1 Tax=Gongylonema pulchrum TaxID=637853 RepID=A0A183E4N6_9BILA|nr:unnamed protein product [Gongylonema pulchrum]